jgi:hypothetical protein
LLAGAAVLGLWAWFLLGFLGEPSAVGRSRAALGIVAGGSIGTAIFAALAALALVMRARWAPRLAMVAAAFMVLTCVGAVAGLPALIGLMWPRRSP